MITIYTKPSQAKEIAAKILEANDTATVSDLDVIDELITQSTDIRFIDSNGRVLTHEMAKTLRYEMGLDIR